MVEAFFRGIDAGWSSTQPEKIELRVIGSGALMLQVDYVRCTKDSDVLETAQLTAGIKDRLLELAGKGTAIHTKHRLYLDIVHSGLPFLPQAPRWHPLGDLNESLRHFELHVLDVVDVVVSKLKRFNADDRSDIEAMVELERVPHAELISRFKSAVDIYSMDARARSSKIRAKPESGRA
jgi:hypothetical protein